MGIPFWECSWVHVPGLQAANEGIIIPGADAPTSTLLEGQDTGSLVMKVVRLIQPILLLHDRYLAEGLIRDVTLFDQSTNLFRIRRSDDEVSAQCVHEERGGDDEQGDRPALENLISETVVTAVEVENDPYSRDEAQQGLGKGEDEPK